MGLVKSLAAAAWADGEISREEETAIRRIAHGLGLDDQERTELETLLRRPVGRDEAEALVRELVPILSQEDRSEWMRHIEEVIAADARVDPAEVELLAGLRDALAEAQEEEKLLGRIRGIFTKQRESRNESQGRGALFARIRDRLRQAQPSGGSPSDERERAVLFGAILYRVAFADGSFDGREKERLQTLLTESFGFESAEALQILAVLESRAAEDLDRQRLCASFNRIATMRERMQLLGCLFMVAEADGEIGEAELREMRLIANYLWIGARDFNRIRINHLADEDRHAV